MNKKIDTLIMKGKPVSDKIIEVLISRIEKLKKKSGRSPGLAVILVGEDPASQVYVRLKGKMADKVGIETYDYKLSSDISFEELSNFAKWVLSFAMLLGRLEIFTLLVLFFPSFWRT